MNVTDRQISIRNYTEADKAECLKAFRSNIPAFFLPNELEEFEQWLLKYTRAVDSQHEICRYYVITVDDRVNGCGGFAINLNSKDARMVWGFIDRNAHRRGLGRKLLFWRIKSLRDLAPDCTIALDTTQHSAPFFEKLGFDTVKITKDFYGKDMHRYDMVKRGY